MPDPLGDFSYTWPFYAAAIVGYLLGSIPFGLVLTRLAGQGDIRKMGSGNIGATNVLRTGNKVLAALTLILDAGKGLLAAGAAGHFFGPDLAVLAGGGALLGHLFPVWLRFRGGKGVATGIGVMLGIAWPVGVLMIASWMAVALLTRYSSLAALVSFILSPVYAWFMADLQTVEFSAFIAILICVRHTQNVRRLVRGEETRIGDRT